MKKLNTLALLFSLITVFVNGQNMQIEWQQCFGGSENESISDIVGHEGNYYILGSTESNNGDINFLHGGQDGWLIKADDTGNLLWEKTFGGSNGDHLLKILPTPDNMFYLLGSSYSSDGDISNDPYPESTDFWILKIDSVGNILWDKILGGNILDQMWSGTVTEDGGVVAIGWTGSSDGDVSESYGFYDMWMVKLNSGGELEWDFSIGTSGLDAGQAIIQTSDGGYLVGGSSQIDTGGNINCVPHSWAAEAMLIKIDENRNIEWQRCYGGSEHDGVTALVEVDDGYIFGAYVKSNDGDIFGWHGEHDIWIVKTNFSGVIEWQQCLGGSLSEFVTRIFVTEEYDVLISGATQSIDGDVTGNHTISEHAYDIWLVKLNSEGELLSEQCFGGRWDEQVSFGFLPIDENTYVIAGQTDYGPSFDVACTPHGGNYDQDFWVFEIKDTTTNIAPVPINDIEFKVYPNPAQDYVVFEVESVKLKVQSSTSSIKLINLFGQEIAALPIINEKTFFDCRSVKSGIYFYKLEIEDMRIGGKLIIQK